MSKVLWTGPALIAGMMALLLVAAVTVAPRIVSAADAAEMRGGDASTCTSSIANSLDGCWNRNFILPNGVRVKCTNGPELDQFCVAAEYQNGIGCFRSTDICTGAEERWNGNQWIAYLPTCADVRYDTAGMIDESGCIAPL